MASSSSDDAKRPRLDFMRDYDYFMALALLTGQRSTAPPPQKKVGACIVKDNKVIAVGYHQVQELSNDRHCEYHAEIDAIMNCAHVHGGTMFVTEFPCNECVKVIVQAGIVRVVYLSEDNEEKMKMKKDASKKMLAKENVCREKYEGPKDDIHVKFVRDLKGRTSQRSEEEQERMIPFMAVAVLTSMKSRDPSTQVGACIVKGDKVIGAGHNQMPNDHTEKYTWSRDKSMDNKYLYVCHAELNAILSSTDAKDCTIYVTLFPCSDCAKLLIQAGIKRVIYLSDKYAEEEDTKLSKEILRAKGIVFEPFNREDDHQQDIVITFH